MTTRTLEDGEQRTRVAVSADGIHFEARPGILGNSYFRVFRHRGRHYALVASRGGVPIHRGR